MRILYLSRDVIASPAAGGSMRMCAALARAGHQVELVARRGDETTGGGEAFAHHGVEPSFHMLELARPAGPGGGLLFALRLARRLWRRRAETDLVYSRDPWGAWLAARLGLPLLVEMLDVPRGTVARWLHRSTLGAPCFRRLVAVSFGLERDLERAGCLPPRPASVLVAHFAAEPYVGAVVSAALGPGGRRVLRVGGAGQPRSAGESTMVEALAERFPTVRFEVMGGAPAETGGPAGAACDNLHFDGAVRPADLAARAAGCDVLLMPSPPTSGELPGRGGSAPRLPSETFEFMSTGRPIVAADLPAVREVLAGGVNALLVPPADPGAWEDALRRLLGDDALRARLGRAARDDVLRQHTWSARAAKVLHGL